jgi:hypothetical protein
VNINIQSKAVNTLSSATAIGAMFALGLSSVLLIGSIAPAAASSSGPQRNSSVSRIPPPDVRDHRDGPKVIHDHQNGTTTRDQRAPMARGGVTVGQGKPRSRHVPCYGNLC